MGDGPMDRLWAGWRSAYVTAHGNGGLVGTGSVPGSGSVFRRILDSGLPDDQTYIVWRGPLTFAILNAFPYTNGHMLLMPYREAGELEDLTVEETAELWGAVRDAVVALKAAYRPHGVNVGLNLGEAAGAGVPSHLHIHVLPRWSADSNFMTAVAETRVLPESLGESWARLREAWPTLGPISATP
ncbi:MAG TPA: HIT domain-containing protein [Acidimicrobiales bacterium]|nr:HIT domain-containing protein [Acidimicrobiales bacterium]